MDQDLIKMMKIDRGFFCRTHACCFERTDCVVMYYATSQNNMTIARIHSHSYYMVENISEALCSSMRQTITLDEPWIRQTATRGKRLQGTNGDLKFKLIQKAKTYEKLSQGPIVGSAWNKTRSENTEVMNSERLEQRTNLCGIYFPMIFELEDVG